MTAYDPKGYWEGQHRRNTLAGVGQSGYPEYVNRALYRAWRATGLSFLRRHHVRARSVLEVGAGRGDWFGTWRAIGARRIVATDLSPTAVARLADVADESHVLDLTARGFTAAVGEHDLVAAMYVLLHITDDMAFADALRNLASAVRPGGWLLLADPILVSNPEGQQRSPHSVSRPLDVYDPFGLRRVAVEPASIICGNPVDATGVRWHAYQLAWRLTARVPGVSLITARIDPWLSRSGLRGPSAKLALFRRESGS